MGKPHASRAEVVTESLVGYRPALDSYARGLIARIQRDHTDAEAVLSLKAHYEAHGDLPSLANLMEGWAQTMRAAEDAADAYVAAGDAALAARDRFRARWLFQCALERLPKHEVARARLETLGRATPPPPPPQRAVRATGSKPPKPISQIRRVNPEIGWLADEDLLSLDEDAPSRARRYEETQRIWRPQLG